MGNLWHQSLSESGLSSSNLKPGLVSSDVSHQKKQKDLINVLVTNTFLYLQVSEHFSIIYSKIKHNPNKKCIKFQTQFKNCITTKVLFELRARDSFSNGGPGQHDRSVPISDKIFMDVFVQITGIFVKSVLVILLIASVASK